MLMMICYKVTTHPHCHSRWSVTAMELEMLKDEKGTFRFCKMLGISSVAE
jgi:hypothetical protein